MSARRLVLAVVSTFTALSGSVFAQLPDDSHWFYEYGGPNSEPFGIEMAGDYAYVYGGFLQVGGNPPFR